MIKTKDTYSYVEKDLIYWRDRIDQKIIDAVRLGMQTGMRGHIEHDPLVMERLHELLTINCALRPSKGYEKGEIVIYGTE